MGRVKNLQMEFDEHIEILDSLHHKIQKISLLGINYVYVNKQLDLIDQNLDACHTVEFMADFVSSKVPTLEACDLILEKIISQREHEEITQDVFEQKCTSIIHKLSFQLSKIIERQESSRNNETAFNSEDYYKTQLNELQEQKKALQDSLIRKTEENEKLSKENKTLDKEKSEAQRSKENIEAKISELNNLIENLQLELALKQKHENAIDEWDNKITTSFKTLRQDLSPVSKEHKRLEILYWIYFALFCLVILFIVLYECFTYCNLDKTDAILQWEEVAKMIWPIPIAGGLLWLFISQMNRAQRQLVILAKHIHEIEYTEGLLKAINSLSTNMNESMERVNNALEKLLDKHLTYNQHFCDYNEEIIKKEENKDFVPADVVIKLLNTTKELISKNN